MSKVVKSEKHIEDAMAEALAAVERIERTSKKGPEDADPVDVEVSVAPEQEEEPPGEAGEEGRDDQREQLLRLAADFENFRKRASRQLEETRRFGNEKLMRDLLPIVDNLERALVHSEGEASAIVQGVRMVAKQFLDVLGAYGVSRFESLGEPFDPERHEAVGKIPAADEPPGSILEEMLKGYHLHDRLLRPAQVIVAAAPEKAPATTSDDAGDA